MDGSKLLIELEEDEKMYREILSTIKNVLHDNESLGVEPNSNKVIDYVKYQTKLFTTLTIKDKVLFLMKE